MTETKQKKKTFILQFYALYCYYNEIGDLNQTLKNEEKKKKQEQEKLLIKSVRLQNFIIYI